VLWEVFKCLDEGIWIMSEGDEYTWDQGNPAGPTATQTHPQPQWTTHVHFDIKPENGKPSLICFDFALHS
jgi:hypothetical protein